MPMSQEEISECVKNTNPFDCIHKLLDTSCLTYKKYVAQIKSHQLQHSMMSTRALNKRLNMYSASEKFINLNSHALCKQDFLSLAQQDGWLSDQVIAFYLSNVLQQRQSWLRVYHSVNSKKWYITSTSFFQQLLATRYDPPIQWTYQPLYGKSLLRRVDFNGYGGQLIPIHLNNNHWALLKVDFSVKSITYIDSLLAIESKARTLIDAYIRYYCEGRAAITPRKTPKIAQHEWSINIMTARFVTQQENSFDCGVFCVMFADFIMMGHTLKFDTRLATQYRRMMFNHIASYVRNFQADA